MAKGDRGLLKSRNGVMFERQRIADVFAINNPMPAPCAPVAFGKG